MRPFLSQLALCFATGEIAKAPEWIELLPAGAVIQGRDGRVFRRTAQGDAEILKRLRDFGDVVLDWEHASEVKAPQGDQAPAAGWLVEFEFRAGALWARVAWSASGRASVENREYRFVSPALLLAGDGTVVGISSAGLVGKPNLELTALNSTEQTGQIIMDEILKALGLGADAGTAGAVAAIAGLQQQVALNNRNNQNQDAPPDPRLYAPVAELNAVRGRAEQAEAELNALKDQHHKAEVTRVVEAACAAGKITPASKDYYIGTCATVEGLNAFQAFVAAQPEMAGASAAAGKIAPAQTGASALTPEQKSLCATMGLSEEVYLQTLQAEETAHGTVQ